MNALHTQGRRVRSATPQQRNLQIDEVTYENIKRYAGLSEAELTRRIKELEKEWDVERVLGANMSTLAVIGFLLSGFKSNKWLTLPAVVLGFFAQHSTQGWCPPVTVFRMMKIRTRGEIEEEKHALKALRGDYQGVKTAEEAFIAAKQREP